MKLYMVHVGYYDLDSGEGIYESHKNFFVAAKDPKEAKSKTFDLEEFTKKNMHIDGIKEISNVQGYEVSLVKNENLREGEVLGYDQSREL
tara:strand:+ start:1654 stop:1923 length:270 start_codon:yes stop_codon:yes gene_type:complete